MARFAVLGNTGVDITLQGALPSAPAGSDGWTDRNVRFLDQSPAAVVAGNGGAAAYVLARLGEQVTLVTALGTDPFGRMARDQLEGAGVEIRTEEDATTPVNIIGVDEAGGRASAYYTGSSVPWKLVLEDRFDWVFAAGYGQVGLEDLDTLGAIFGTVRNGGGKVAFDPGPWFARAPFLVRLKEVVEGVDCVLGTEEELGGVVSESDVETIASRLLSSGPACAAVKRGRAGALVATESGVVHQPVDPVGDAHSVGAGDCFNAVFLSAFARGRSPSEAVRSAVEFSRRVVEGGGGAAGASMDGLFDSV